MDGQCIECNDFSIGDLHLYFGVSQYYSSGHNILDSEASWSWLLKRQLKASCSTRDDRRLAKQIRGKRNSAPNPTDITAVVVADLLIVLTDDAPMWAEQLRCMMEIHWWTDFKRSTLLSRWEVPKRRIWVSDEFKSSPFASMHTKWTPLKIVHNRVIELDENK